MLTFKNHYTVNFTTTYIVFSIYVLRSEKVEFFFA